ncbi:MAG: hypothetical protein GY714_25745 [Desulfobacterales bacterium]|nr:hypothetical protein [Desulfobacterales bacterium]
MIELVVAVAIFGLVITIVYSSFNTIIQGSETIKVRSSCTESAKHALMIIENDFNSLFVSVEPEYSKPDLRDSKDPFRFICEKYFVDGKEFSKLRFTTFNHISLNSLKTKSLSYVQYYVVNDPENGLILKRSDSLNFSDEDFTEDLKAPSLCEGIDSFKLTLLDKDNNEVNVWNSEDSSHYYSTPQYIKINIALKCKDTIQNLRTGFAINHYREPLN